MLIIKGIIIGIGKIIPGVSGSMLAISMGIYKKLIDSINNFFKNIKDNSIFLSKVIIGILISIICFSNVIVYLLNNHYLITMFFFIGLIIGSLNDIKKPKNNYLITILTFIITTILGFISIDNNIVIKDNILNFIYYLFVGFIDAITMVVPGISGTATLMMIGAYDTLITTYSSIFNIDLLITNIKILIPFLLGIVIGVIITAKIINYLFKYRSDKTYSAILGFSISTIVLMFIRSFNTNLTLLNLFISIIFLILGIVLIKKINQRISD